VEADQKKLDQRLRDQQFYTRSLIESNIDALMTTDPLGIITDVNKQMRRSRLHARRVDWRAVQELLYRSGAGRSGIKLVLSEKKSPTTNSPRAPGWQENRVSTTPHFYDRDRTLQGVLAVARDVTEPSATSRRSRKPSRTGEASPPRSKPTSRNRISFPA